MEERSVTIHNGEFERVLAVAFAPVVALTELIKNSSDACMSENDSIKIYFDTKTKSIRLIDNGYGFSNKDIEQLPDVGRSQKMSGGNTRSRIGEPYAGCKGLGIITVFNLCQKLEILTYSQEDQKTYRIVWQKGTAKITWDKISEKRMGSEFILHDVGDEEFKLLLLEDELQKLYLASVKYSLVNSRLPGIEIFVNGKLVDMAPKIKMDPLYHSLKGTKNGFIAKATFKYQKNSLQLSYEDNLTGVFSFADERIDLTDFDTIDALAKRHNIKWINNLKPSVANFDKDTFVNDFSGCYYIWRGNKRENLSYPFGVRVYINGYGLYNYLNKDFDWLSLSEISQNKKATNYKLKNTYGFVLFDDFDESASALKISNERNDFYENLAKKKFFMIMKDFVSEIFSAIDITIKNGSDGHVFLKRQNAKTHVHIGEKLYFSELIITNLSQADIIVNAPAATIIDNNEECVVFSSEGQKKISFKYEENVIDIIIDVENNIPFFELKKDRLSVKENNAYDLTKLIKTTSLKNLGISDIIISSNDGAKILGNKLLSADNLPGQYTVLYKYSEEMTNSLRLTITPREYKNIERMINLFPHRCDKYPKIYDIIEAIAFCWKRHPVLCAIGIRPLVEFALKAFIAELYPEDERKKIFDDAKKSSGNFDVPGRLNGFFDKIRKDDLKTVSSDVLSKYQSTLTDVGKSISKAYRDLEPNVHIHNPLSCATSSEIFSLMKKLQPFLNFIIDAINANR